MKDHPPGIRYSLNEFCRKHFYNVAITVLILWNLYVTLLIYNNNNNNNSIVSSPLRSEQPSASQSLTSSFASYLTKKTPTIPPFKLLLGDKPINGMKPLFGKSHSGKDAVFALASNYDLLQFRRFVGSLRKVGYTDDIVLGVNTLAKLNPNVKDYILSQNIIAYGVDYLCAKEDHCQLPDNFYGYPDPRPARSFANIRYAMYEYWLQFYSDRSYILLIDFRDTFFQINPFSFYPMYAQRPEHKFELNMYAENTKVKKIGTCVFNTGWIAGCWGQKAAAELKENPVICSGSTFGSYLGITHYTQVMLQTFDSIKCQESDQGYHNYLYYHGKFESPYGNTTLNHQGTGLINTIGAMNGARIPPEYRGSLDKFWKIRDVDGYILNYDGKKSPVIHQWDRWETELISFVDSKTYDRN